MDWSLRRSWRAVAAALFCLLILLAGVVRWRASRALRSATQEVRSEGEIRFTARPLPEPQEQDFESISTPAVFFQAARFLGDLYIAGPAGLSQYNASGTLLKHYAVGRELPSSPLVAMAPAVLADSREPELVIATAQDGLAGLQRSRLPANFAAGSKCAHHYLGLARCFRTSLDWNQEARRAPL